MELRAGVNMTMTGNLGLVNEDFDVDTIQYLNIQQCNQKFNQFLVVKGYAPKSTQGINRV